VQLWTNEELLASAGGDAAKLYQTVAASQSTVQFCVSSVKQCVTQHHDEIQSCSLPVIYLYCFCFVGTVQLQQQRNTMSASCTS